MPRNDIYGLTGRIGDHTIFAAQKTRRPLTRLYILKALLRRTKNSGIRYLIEKTPSNCFRVGFLAALFPEAKYIQIIRVGRDVAISSMRAFFGERSLLDRGHEQTICHRTFAQRIAQFSQRFPAFLDRFRERDMPPSGWLPYLLSNMARVWQMFVSSKLPLWDARFPGMSAAQQIFYSLD